MAVQHLDAELQKIGHPLTFGMGCRPQLEILDSVVDAMSISMMDHVIGQKRATEMQGHHQAVLADLCHAPA